MTWFLIKVLFELASLQVLSGEKIKKKMMILISP